MLNISTGKKYEKGKWKKVSYSNYSASSNYSIAEALSPNLY